MIFRVIMALIWKFRQNGQKIYLIGTNLKQRKQRQFYNYENIAIEKQTKIKEQTLKKRHNQTKICFCSISLVIRDKLTLK